MSETIQTYGPWWGEARIPEGETRCWRIGPFHLWVTRSNREWRIAYRRDEDPFQTTLMVNEPGPEPEVPWARVVAPGPGETRFTRFGYRGKSDELRLTPAHADRPLVVNVRVPFVLLPGQEVQLYVSSPLWLRVELSQPFVLAQEIPLFRPSDTWFGPNTRQGELCYASRTGARLELGNLPAPPQRATSAVQIRNRAASELRIDRLKFPMPNLSLFVDAQGHLWTEQMRLDREHDGQDASVRLEKHPPGELGETKRVSGPRSRATKKFLTRAFGSFFDVAGGVEP